MSCHAKPVGLYIHIPFCITKCNYCKFYSLKYDKITADSYKSAVIRNIHEVTEGGLNFNTVFFGGGTPSLLYCEIAEIINVLPLTPHAEITVEANPDDITPIMLRTLLKAGVNRLSVGVQSLHDTVLKKLGRRHDSKTAVSAIKTAFEYGFLNNSADIMLGIPGQTVQSLERELDVLTGSGLAHISAYIYENEETLSEDETAEMYLKVAEILEVHDFPQYEISNFGLPCRHNLKYWNCEEYLGIGAAAHSYYGGKRFSVPPDIELFINSPVQKIVTTETNPATFEERVMLGLRLTEGIKFHGFTEREQELLLSRASAIPKEYIRLNEKKNLSLTRKGFLVSNRIIGELLF